MLQALLLGYSQVVSNLDEVDNSTSRLTIEAKKKQAVRDE